MFIQIINYECGGSNKTHINPVLQNIINNRIMLQNIQQQNNGLFKNLKNKILKKFKQLIKYDFIVASIMFVTAGTFIALLNNIMTYLNVINSFLILTFTQTTNLFVVFGMFLFVIGFVSYLVHSCKLFLINNCNIIRFN